MLKKKALRRIFITTIAIFVVLVIYSLKSIEKDVIIYDDAYYIKESDMNVIYALNNDNYISKTTVYVDNKLPLEEKVKTLLEIMIEKNNKNALLPSYFKPILPKNTEVLSIKLVDDILRANFNKALLDITKEQSEQMMEAIIYTLTEFDNVLGIEIYVEDKLIEYVPHSKTKLATVLTREFGINKVYNIVGTNNINKVFLYYLSENNDMLYYVPVTKYLNDDREKIEIIVEYLSSHYIHENNLKSYLNNKTKLLDYELDENKIAIVFNEEAIDNKKDNTINDEALNALIYSVFDNYDISKIEILVGDTKIIEKNRKDIE